MTTHETRLELLVVLMDSGRAHLNWRLGQTLANLAMAAGRLDAEAVWDLEDGEALTTARRLLESCSETLTTNA